jgi:hypothetical protein
MLAKSIRMSFEDMEIPHHTKLYLIHGKKWQRVNYNQTSSLRKFIHARNSLVVGRDYVAYRTSQEQKFGCITHHNNKRSRVFLNIEFELRKHITTFTQIP